MARTSMRPLLQGVMRRAGKHLIPLQVSMELTHRCNLSCKHCYVDVPPDNEITTTEIKDIIDQLTEAGCMYLMLTGGEVLTRPDFFDITFYAEKIGVKVNILTNGTLITPEIAGEMQKLRPDFVVVSLYGSTAKSHDSVTRTPGSLEATIQGVKLLNRVDVTVILQTLLMDSNYHEADSMKTLAAELGVPLRIRHELIPARSGLLTPYQYQLEPEQACRHIGRFWENNGTVPSKNSELCMAGKGMCSISPAGDVFPCLIMPMVVGNLRQNSFKDIWKDNPCHELIHLRSLKWQDLSECSECTLSKYCKKCIGLAFSETGSLTRPAPSACRDATLKSEYFGERGC